MKQKLTTFICICICICNVVSIPISSAIFLHHRQKPSSNIQVVQVHSHIASSGSRNLQAAADIFPNINELLARLPYAVTSTIKTAVVSFVESLLLMIPIGLLVKLAKSPLLPSGAMAPWFSQIVMAADRLSRLKVWLSEGAHVGIEWSRISAIYSGGEGTKTKTTITVNNA